MSDSLARYLARQVRAERARLGLSQEALGARLGWSKSAVSALELGTRRVFAAELPELCQALDVSLLDLLARADAADRRAMKLP